MDKNNKRYADMSKALRENLLKRKAQTRSRKEEDKKTIDAHEDPQESDNNDPCDHE